MKPKFILVYIYKTNYLFNNSRNLKKKMVNSDICLNDLYLSFGQKWYCYISKVAFHICKCFLVCTRWPFAVLKVMIYFRLSDSLYFNEMQR